MVDLLVVVVSGVDSKVRAVVDLVVVVVVVCVIVIVGFSVVELDLDMDVGPGLVDGKV